MNTIRRSNERGHAENAAFHAHLKRDAVGSEGIETAFHIESVRVDEGIFAGTDAKPPVVFEHAKTGAPDIHAERIGAVLTAGKYRRDALLE